MTAPPVHELCRRELGTVRCVHCQQPLEPLEQRRCAELQHRRTTRAGLRDVGRGSFEANYRLMRDALPPGDLDEQQERYMRWLAQWDHDTAEAVASLFRFARGTTTEARCSVRGVPCVESIVKPGRCCWCDRDVRDRPHH